MAANLLDGKSCAEQTLGDIKSSIQTQSKEGHRSPCLAVVIVGDDPASHIYVGRKEKACLHVGIESRRYNLNANANPKELTDLIDQLNSDDTVDGILVQTPLPNQFDLNDILMRIDPFKDVDGFHPMNIGRLAIRDPYLNSCTPLGVIKLLEHNQIDIKGKNAVVIGASNHVGRPMALNLLLEGATVTVCHRFTQDTPKVAKEADILVVAVGKPQWVKQDWVKEGAIVIDIGINRLDNGKLVGDVDFDTIKEKASWITPVPGGVGQMTVAMLMHNTLFAYQQNIK